MPTPKSTEGRVHGFRPKVGCTAMRSVPGSYGPGAAHNMECMHPMQDLALRRMSREARSSAHCAHLNKSHFPSMAAVLLTVVSSSVLSSTRRAWLVTLKLAHMLISRSGYEVDMIE